MLIPILAGIGALCMSNPPKRKRRKAKRRNPHTAPDGWHYSIKDNREWHEIQIIARTPAGKLHEGRKSFFPYSSGDRASKREARAEAEAHLARLLTRANPRRRAKRRNPGAYDLFDSINRGASVTIRTPQGGTFKGKAYLLGPSGWVLGAGPHGARVKIATPTNIVSVRKARTK